MGFWFTFIFFLGVQVVTALLIKPKVEDARPSGLGDFRVPTATEGRVVPVLVGMCKVDGPNVIWYGNLGTQAITEKVGGFAGIGGKRVTKGYRYFLGVQCAIASGPIDGVRRIWFGDKVISDAEVLGGAISILNTEFFGGDDQGGGINFELNFQLGNQTTANSYLTTQQTPTPSYRGICYALLSDGQGGPGYIGNAAQLRNLAFEAFWFPNSLGVTGGKERIGNDANPICFLYEILVSNDDWGLQFDPGDVLVNGTVDEGAFIAVAEQVADEGLGFSMVIDRATEVREIIREIERHVDGAFSLDLATGQFKITLARQDGGITTLDDSNIVEFQNYAQGNWAQTKNEVRVEFQDRAKEYDSTYQHDFDNANFQITGRRSVATLRFPAVKAASTANSIASREIVSLANPLAKAKLTVNRELYQLRRGSRVSLTWTPLGISSLAMRVVRVAYGNDQRGLITLDLVEDIFRLETTGFSDVPGSLWVPPVTDPADVVAARFWEPPGPLAPTTGLVILAARNGGLQLAYDVYLDRTGGSSFEIDTDNNSSWTPKAQLDGAMVRDLGDATPFVDTITIDNLVDITIGQLTDAASTTVNSDDPTNLVLIDDELIWFEGITDNGDGSVDLTGVNRGAVGTVVAAHANDADVWFPVLGATLVEKDGATSIRARIVSKTATGELDLSAASDVGPYTIDNVVPYAPRNVALNGNLLVDDDGWTQVYATLRFTWRGWSSGSALNVKQDDDNQFADGLTAYTVIVKRVDTDAAIVTRAGIPLGADGGGFNVQGFVPLTGTPGPVLDPGDSATSPASDFVERDFYAEVFSRSQSVDSPILTSRNFEVIGWGMEWDPSVSGGDVLDPGDTPVVGAGAGAWNGFNLADSGGVVLDQGDAPVIIEPVPGVDVLREVRITFSGSPTADDEYSIFTSFNGPNEVVNSTTSITGATPEEMAENLFAFWSGIATSEWAENVNLSLVGATVTASSFFGSLFATATSVAGFANISILQQGFNAGSGRPEFGHIDFYDITTNANGDPVEILAPSSDPDYQAGSNDIYRFIVVGLTHDARVALNPANNGRPVNGREFSIPFTQNLKSTTNGIYFQDLSVLKTAIESLNSWSPYILDFSLSFTDQQIGSSTLRMQRSGLTYAAQEGYGIARQFHETTDPNNPTDYKLLARKHIAADPTNAGQHIVRASLLNDAARGGDALAADQEFSVILGGVDYSEQITAGDLITDPAYPDPAIERLADAIETGPYTVDRLTLNRQADDADGAGGRRTFISELVIRSTAVGVAAIFTADAQASYGARVDIEVI